MPVHKGFFADTLADRPPLLRAMLAANGAARRLALTRPDSASPWAAVESALRADPRVRPLAPVSPPAFFWDYTEESRRVALLPPEKIVLLGRLFGVAVHAPEVARVVIRSEALALRAALGPEFYSYALYRGQYQLGEVRRFFLAGEDAAFPLPGRIALHGWQGLALCALRWPDVLRERFLEQPGLVALRQEGDPEGIREISCRPGFSASEGEGAHKLRQLWFSLKNILLKEVAPSWAPCFD